MTNALDQFDPLEPWETPQMRAKREAWRGGVASVPKPAGDQTLTVPIERSAVRTVTAVKTVTVHLPAPTGQDQITAFIKAMLSTGALSSLAQAISTATAFRVFQRLEREVDELRRWKAAHEAALVVSAPANDEETRSAVFTQARTAASNAAREAVGQYSPIVTLERASSSDSLAQDIVFVTIREPDAAEELVVVEREFYRVLRNKLPKDLTPIVDVVLRFETRPA